MQVDIEYWPCLAFDCAIVTSFGGVDYLQDITTCRDKISPVINLNNYEVINLSAEGGRCVWNRYGEGNNTPTHISSKEVSPTLKLRSFLVYKK